MTDSASSVGAQQVARTIKIDTEHFAIRFLLPVLTIVAVVMAHLTATRVLDDLLNIANPLCIALPLDALVLFAGSPLIERLLKWLLPSRRHAALTADALVVTDARHDPPEQLHINWHGTLTARAWRFEVQRRGARIPRGWLCLALQLLQDEEDIILYTFMPQKEAEAVPGYAHFVRLRPRQETGSNTDLDAVAEQRRLLKLEDARWKDGAEVDRDDFHAILDTLARVIPGWR